METPAGLRRMKKDGSLEDFLKFAFAVCVAGIVKCLMEDRYKKMLVFEDGFKTMMEKCPGQTIYGWKTMTGVVVFWSSKQGTSWCLFDEDGVGLFCLTNYVEICEELGKTKSSPKVIGSLSEAKCFIS